MRLLLISIVVFQVNFGFSQTEVAPPPTVKLPAPDLSMPTDHSFTTGGNSEARFPGGLERMKQYISENFPLDSIPEETRLNGRVYVQFIVCSSGEIEDVRIARGLNYETDRVCIEFIKNMPNWTPAEDVNGPMDSRVRLPLIFTLY